MIGGKWTLLILFQISDRNVRYGELGRGLPGISEKVLMHELDFLTKHKFVTRTAYPKIPPRVDYSLTDLGKKTLPIIDQLSAFALENLY